MQSYLLKPGQTSELSRKLALLVLGLFGWKVFYKPLPGPRGVIIVYPHTSNWDFPIGVLGKIAIGQRFRFIAKSSLFEGVTGALFGPFLRAIGGSPVERGVSTGAIVRIAEQMHKADWYWLALAPEGTRSLRPYWRSGFYHIARNANVPLACAYFDFRRKCISLTDYLTLTGDPDTDMAAIAAVYKDVQGCRPALAGPVRLKPEETQGGNQA